MREAFGAASASMQACVAPYVGVWRHTRVLGAIRGSRVRRTGSRVYTGTDVAASCLARRAPRIFSGVMGRSLIQTPAALAITRIVSRPWGWEAKPKFSDWTLDNRPS